MPSNRDLDKTIKTTISLSPAARTASANGTGVDIAGFDQVAIVFITGVVTDGTHTPTIEESDSSGSGYTTVDSSNLSGTLAALAAGVLEIGYLGTKRYIRAVITAAGTTTGAVTSALVVAGGARTLPQ